MILSSSVEFPDYTNSPYYKGNGLTSGCKSFIRKLLCKNENKRLGARAGASEVKSHSFFKSINFALLRNMKPPIIPSKAQPIKAVHFTKLKESISFDLTQDGLNTPPAEEEGIDPFLSFHSGNNKDNIRCIDVI
jgi:hypothetical protein